MDLERLSEELQEARRHYPLVVLVNGVPWITKDEPGSRNGWEPYSHGRTIIADMIRADVGLSVDDLRRFQLRKVCPSSGA